MEDIRELLGLWQSKSRSSASVKKVAGRHIETLRAKVTELNAMIHTLEHLTHHCQGDHRPDCPILEDLAGKESHADVH